MRAVLKREIRSYFTSPIGYVCIAVLLALFGYWYYIVMLSGSSANITYVLHDGDPDSDHAHDFG